MQPNDQRNAAPHRAQEKIYLWWTLKRQIWRSIYCSCCFYTRWCSGRGRWGWYYGVQWYWAWGCGARDGRSLERIWAAAMQLTIVRIIYVSWGWWSKIASEYYCDCWSVLTTWTGIDSTDYHATGEKSEPMTELWRNFTYTRVREFGHAHPPSISSPFGRLNGYPYLHDASAKRTCTSRTPPEPRTWKLIQKLLCVLFS